ncbi:MAG: DUF6443 domain-containing protein, partial [Cytophagales bacterium]|nr:DUF6443 domain-containing protein [Cytophagales bacterium]
MKTILIKLSVVIGFIFVANYASAQFTGATSSTVGQIDEYSFTVFDLEPPQNNYFDIVNGSIVSQWSSGFTWYAQVQWQCEGGGQVNFVQNGNLVGTLNVTITCPAVAAPVTSFTTTTQCRTTVLTRTSNPPAGVIWFWQADANGTTIDFGSGPSVNVLTSTVVYLRARLADYNCCWSNALTSPTVTVFDPAAPTTVSGSTVCGSGNATFTATPAAGTNQIRWYNQAGTLLATGTTYTTSISSTTTLYAASFSTSLTCESTARTPVASTVVSPSAGGSVSGSAETYSQANGTLTLSGHTGSVVRWEQNINNTGWTTVTNTTTTFNYSNVTVTTQFRAVVRNTTACAEANSSAAIVTIYSVPTVTNTGTAFLAYGMSTSLNTGTYFSYQWVKDNVDVAGATQNAYTVNSPGSYQVKVRGSSTAPWSTSSVISINASLANQPAAVNWTSSTQVLTEGVADHAALFGLTPSQVQQRVVYADGLGRTFQSVQVGSAPNRGDAVTPVLFGRQGLVDSTFLPYATNVADGRFRPNAVRGSNSPTSYTTSEQYLFYQSTAKVAQDVNPYQRSLYRASPDARVMEQGAPGAAWQPGTNKTVRTLLAANNATYRVRYWKPDGTTNSDYPNNSVSVAISTDENGNQVRTYTNAVGQTVLKQVQIDDTLEGVVTAWLETYYIYDEYGRLKYQVPPKAMKVLGTGATLDAKSSSVAELIYTYTYDARNRVTEKKIPGAAVERIVYDNFDRPVLTQDGNQQAQNRWMFVRYDRYNRVVYSGFYSRTVTRAVLQGEMDILNYNTQPYFETEQVNATTFGYTNTVYPTANLTILAVNYYDHYDFDRNGTADYTYTNSHFAGQEAAALANTRGLVTGSRTRVLDAAGTATGTWLINAVFYDKYDRPIQTRSNNTLYTTVADVQTTVYDFVKPLRTKTTHNQSATTSVVLEDRSDYDHAGRVLKTFRKINTNPEQLLAQYEYNALGQLVDKKLHDVGGGNFLQSVDYRYNIRGWLRSINGSQLTVTGDNDDTNDYFGMELLYNTVESGLGNSQYFNGNISAVKWKGLGTTGAIDQRSYRYGYDKSDRLKTATFQAHSGTAWTREVNTLDEAVTYDHNGNIKTLTRNQNNRGLSGATVTNAPITVDNLTYTYASNLNRLTKVEDAIATITGVNDFKNAVNVATEYTYTTAGDLNADQNKGITSTTYNVLGKPRQITFNNNRRLDYFYDAAGNKTKVQVWTGSPLVLTSTTDYVGGFVYENNNLSFFSSPEGRVVKNGANFEYQYAISDHQGNTRVLFTSAPQVSQTATADFEATTNGNFQNYVNRSGFSLFNRTPLGTTSQLLNGGVNGQVGLAKSYRLYAGDKVKIEAYAKYQNLIGTTSNLGSFASALLTAFALPTPAGGEVGTPSAGVNSWGSAVAGGNGQSENATAPKIFVNLLVLDKNNRVLDIAYKQVTTAAAQNGATPVVPHEYLMREYTAKEECFVYVYVSNEHPTLVDAYFDDVTVTYTPSNVVQYNEYYPFQNTTQNSWTRVNAIKNNFLGNGGTELNSNSQLYDLEYRNYDPILGRMNGVDPMSDKYSSLSPYNYSFNMPNMVVDVNGADPNESVDEWVDRVKKEWEVYDRRGFGAWNQYISDNAGMRGGGSSQGSISSFLSSALASANGGHWANGTWLLFSSQQQAFAYGVRYNDRHNSWGSKYSRDIALSMFDLAQEMQNQDYRTVMACRNCENKPRQTQGVAYVFGSNGALIDSHSIDGPSVAYFMNNGKLGKAYYDLGALQQ